MIQVKENIKDFQTEHEESFSEEKLLVEELEPFDLALLQGCPDWTVT